MTLHTAGVISIFEHYCKAGIVARTFTRWFSESKKAEANRVKRDVAQAVVKVIGSVHLCVQVTFCALNLMPHCESFTRPNKLSFVHTRCVYSSNTWHHRSAFFNRMLGSLQIPLAISVMADPSFQSNRLYATSLSSTGLLTISAGYFLHDVIFPCSFCACLVTRTSILNNKP